VRLSGAARTRRQYERALEIARELVGADKVINDLRLDEHPLVAAVPLEIDVSGQGIVVLRSNRTTEAQRTRLLEIARRVPGVSGIDDDLK